MLAKPVGEVYDVESLKTYNDDKNIYGINPQSIKYIGGKDFSGKCLKEKVASGDWDLDVELFAETSCIYKSYVDVFCNGKAWTDTEVWNGEYQAGTHRIKHLDFTDEELYEIKQKRCSYLSFVFLSMKEFGYIQDPYSDFVGVNIGRDGKIIINNGRHRLAAAQILGINCIPVSIDVRHVKWVQLRNEIIDYSQRHSGMVYAPLGHVDLLDIPVRQTGRFKDIEKEIGEDVRTVVDLGANWGYMCKCLEHLGLQCTAVEIDDIEFYFLNALKGDYKFVTTQDDICNFVDKHFKFDCVFAISIFHHLAKSKDGHDKLIKLLSRLECKEMFFQMPDSNEMKLEECYRDYSWKEFMELIIEHSCLNHYKELGDRKNRKLFKLWR